MSDLDHLIKAAFATVGQTDAVSRFYLSFLRTPLFIPTQKEASKTSEEPFSPLFANIENNIYLLAFSTLDRLYAWAKDAIKEMNYVELTGEDLIVGTQEKVYLCLNVGTEFYKEISPDEVMHLKKIVQRIRLLK